MLSLLILIPLFLVIMVNLPFLRFLRKVSSGIGFLFALAQACAASTAFFIPELFRGRDFLADTLILHFSADSFTVLMLLCIGISGAASALVGSRTLKNESTRFKFDNLLLIAMIGMNGTVLLNDLFSLYVFIEVTAVATFIMIVLHKNENEFEGSFKYLLLSMIASILLLSSVSLLMIIAGSTSFDAVRTALSMEGTLIPARLAVLLFVCALLMKGGVFPFHWLLPDAYTTAPAAPAILLVGVISKISGVYALMRLSTSVFGLSVMLQNLLMIVGTLSILGGAFLALRQTDFRRMLAYSSISQVGYIVLGLASANPLGIAGAAFHFFNHTVFKSLLFTNAAAIEERLGTMNMDAMGGVSSRMRTTGITSLLGFFSAAGIPPLGGFWSKLLIVVALWQEHLYGFAATAILASILTLAYFLSMQRRVFFGLLRAGLDDLREASGPIVAAEVLLGCVTVGAGLAFPALYDWFVVEIGKQLLR